MMRNDEGQRTKKTTKHVIESEETTETQARNYDRKFTFCPICHANGNFSHFKKHMYTYHNDYIKKYNITPLIFEFLELLANSDYSTKDKFVYYDWPETSEWINADLSNITARHYRGIGYAFWLVKDSQKNVSINDLIRSLMLYRQMEQITAHDFIKRCVEEEILIYDGLFYLLNKPKYTQTLIFRTSGLTMN